MNWTSTRKRQKRARSMRSSRTTKKLTKWERKSWFKRKNSETCKTNSKRSTLSTTKFQIGQRKSMASLERLPTIAVWLHNQMIFAKCSRPWRRSRLRSLSSLRNAMTKTQLSQTILSSTLQLKNSSPKTSELDPFQVLLMETRPRMAGNPMCQKEARTRRTRSRRSILRPSLSLMSREKRSRRKLKLTRKRRGRSSCRRRKKLTKSDVNKQ